MSKEEEEKSGMSYKGKSAAKRCMTRRVGKCRKREE